MSGANGPRNVVVRRVGGSLVVFFRGLHCPVCRKQLSELDRRLSHLREAGVGRVLAVSMETPERSAQLVQEWHLGDLPVAHGLSEASAREWGLSVSTAIRDGEAPVFNEPGVFVLDADGTVYRSNISSIDAVRTPGPRRRARRAAVRAAAGLSGPGRGLSRNAAITGMSG